MVMNVESVETGFMLLQAVSDCRHGGLHASAPLVQYLVRDFVWSTYNEDTPESLLIKRKNLFN